MYNHYSDPTASAAIGAVSREWTQRVCLAITLRERPTFDPERDSVKRCFMGIYARLLTIPFEELKSMATAKQLKSFHRAVEKARRAAREAEQKAKEAAKEAPKDKVKEAAKETPKVTAKDKAKETPKETAKDKAKEAAKDKAKEAAKETPKETASKKASA